ncbi:GntR family transcriptional regulator [Cohnella cholangitidis]|uniref:GntR family transcriptional regulator n=1 Tax=Cohnella cholangitidis TaxID=2598458 RepID=A0A7G5C1D3_9BACL|nr:GntR family transcriptional regulator [Cohnella cholangitidis]QMV43017.1 GntR family transcriptional regulator [Cohnella cholangitidis]
MWLPIRIDEQRPEPLYHQIEVQLRGLILGGQLAEGTLLPSIRELAVSLKCSAITVRRVYQDLENEGLIRTRQGTGTFVAGVGSVVRDEHRLERASEELERAVEAGLQLNCKLEELENAFQRIIHRKRAEGKGG